MSAGRPGAVESTSRLLTELLRDQASYRRAWQQHCKRERAGDLSKAAIAQVIAEYLWDSGERVDTDIELARRLRDRVRRALEGEKLTAETLTWFIHAFNMKETHEHHLWSTFAGGTVNYRQGISGTLTAPRRMVRPMGHKTISMFERYIVNGEQRVTDKHVLRVIEAVDDGVDRFLYTDSPIKETVEVIDGGRIGASHDAGDGRVLREIVLDKPLRKGFTAALEYNTRYVVSHRPLEVRRALPGRYENIDMAIQFDPRRLPRSVRFAAWPEYFTGDPVLTETLTLNATGSCHRFVPYVEQ